MHAALHLAEHLHEAPVHLFVAGRTRRGEPQVQALFPAIQNVLLACRAVGLGASLTTLHPRPRRDRPLPRAPPSSRAARCSRSAGRAAATAARRGAASTPACSGSATRRRPRSRAASPGSCSSKPLPCASDRGRAGPASGPTGRARGAARGKTLGFHQRQAAVRPFQALLDRSIGNMEAAPRIARASARGRVAGACNRCSGHNRTRAQNPAPRTNTSVLRRRTGTAADNPGTAVSRRSNG